MSRFLIAPGEVFWSLRNSDLQQGVGCAALLLWYAAMGGPCTGRSYDPGVMATMSEEALIKEAGRRLSAAAPDASIILFGSRAWGGSRQDSDLDVLVIEPDFARRGEEYGRLRKELRGLGVAIDLVIYRRHEAEERCGVPGSLLHRALREGRVLSQA